MSRSELEVEIAKAVKEKWQDNGVEFLVGAISSIATTGQLKALLRGVKENGSFN